MLLLLLAPILFNLTGVVDTYLTKRFHRDQNNGILESGTSMLMIIGGLVALIFALAIGVFNIESIFEITNGTIGWLLLSGLLYGLAAWPYFEALKIEKIENIIPFLQTIPIFTYIIANVILGESMSGWSVLLMIIIVLITALFSWDIHTKKINIKGLLLILLCACMYSTSYVVFKIGGGESLSLRGSYFREHIGVAIACLSFGFPRKVKASVIGYFKSSGIGFSILNIGNEGFYIGGMLILNYISLSHDIAFINTISNGLQPLLGFIMMFISHKALPKIYDRDYSRAEIVWKITLCVISCLLLYLFFIIQ